MNILADIHFILNLMELEIGIGFEKSIYIFLRCKLTAPILPIIELEVPLSISEIYFVDPLVTVINSVNNFCIIIGNVSNFWGLWYWKAVNVHQSQELASLLICYLDVLPNHSFLIFLRNKNFQNTYRNFLFIIILDDLEVFLILFPL